MCGRMFNTQSIWGYVTGGMGVISKLLYEAAVENGNQRFRF